MIKKAYILGTLITIISLLLASGVVLPSDIWTSVVLLNINGHKYMDDYELIDNGKTVMPGLKSLGKILDAEVVLKPDKMIAKVNCSWNNKTILVDLNQQTVSISEKKLIMKPEAIAAYGDYFIPLQLAKEIFQADLEWSSLSQSLNVTVDRELSIFTPVKEKKLKNNNKKIKEKNEVQPEPDIRMPFFTFGSVQYEIEQDFSTQQGDSSTSNLMFDMHMQAGGVPIDIYLESDNFLNSERDVKLQKAAATYKSHSRQIILGDTGIQLGKILEKTAIRGISYSAPPGWTGGSVRAFTVIEGEAESGSEVLLTINGHYFGKKIAADNHYIFDSVPLQILEANEVVIKIINPEGQETTQTRTLSATPRLLSPGSWETAAGLGVVTDDEKNDYRDALIGGALRYGLSSRLTVGGATVLKQSLKNKKQPKQFVGEIGLAFRASDNVIFTIDWLVSKKGEGVDTVLGEGFELEADLNYNTFAVQSIVFYREPDLHVLKKTSNNIKGYQIIAEYELNETMTIEGSYLVSSRVIGEEKALQEIKTVYRWKPSKRSSYTLGLEHKFEVSDRVEMNYKYTHPALETEVGMAGNWNIVEGRRKLDSVETKMDFLKSLPEFLDGSLNSRLTRSDKLSIHLPKSVNKQHESITSLDLSWHPGGNVVNSSVEYKKLSVVDTPEDTVKEGDISLYFSRPLGFFNIGLGLGFHKTSGSDFFEQYRYHLLQLSASKGNFSSKLKLTYNKYIKNKSNDNFEGALKLKYGFPNGLNISLATYVEPDNFSKKMIYSSSLTLSQSIGFSNGGLKGFNKTEGRPMDYVDGFVYVDLNLNGKWDEDEKTLGKIPVNLNGQRTFTDEDGYYCFDYVSPGIYSLGLDITKLPADYTPLNEKKLVELPANANLTMNFGVALYGTIDGTVFIDVNGNGKLDKKEQTPEWVKVLLDGEKECYTDSRGKFTFGSLSVGEHTLTIDTSNFPASLKAPEPLSVAISEDKLDAWGVLIPLSIK